MLRGGGLGGLKTGEKVHFPAKKARPILVFLFVSSLSLVLPQNG